MGKLLSLLFAALLLSGPVSAQSWRDGPPLTVGGQKGITLPTTCTVGKLFFDTDATAGSNIYGCTAANTWTLQGGSGTVSTISFTGGLISIANPTTTPALTVAGTSGGIPYFSAASTWASSALLTQYGVVLGGGAGAAPSASSSITFGGAAAGTGLVFAAGTATTDVPLLSMTRTNNNAAVVKGIDVVYTDTTSAAGFLPLSIKGGAAGAANLVSLSKVGLLTAGGNITSTGGTYNSAAWEFNLKTGKPFDEIIDDLGPFQRAMRDEA